jgi:acetylornithine deacetylase/succinyl-diaminopimelate desuccinylase-like protein
VGAVNATIHKYDEEILVEDIDRMREIYTRIMQHLMLD